MSIEFTEESLNALAASAARLGLSLTEVVEDKRAELDQRFRILCLVHPLAREHLHRRYLGEVIGCDPALVPDEMLEFTRFQDRKLRISESERIAMEDRQNYRCRICGRLLVARSQPHVDHIVPIALGGSDSVQNMQILCAQCNRGKSAFFDWRMAVSYDREGKSRARIRYCVLSRGRSMCSVDDCQRTSRDSQLHLVTKIPSARGGREIFDNLVAVCDDHLRSRRLRQERRNTLLVARATRKGALNGTFD